jgi:uncharacterized repeat protein (TIGR03803 family)
VFEIAKNGDETLRYIFQGENDGGNPSGSLLIDNSGNLYGAADGGAGTNCSGFGCGVVFKLAPGGTEKVLYTFQGGSDGQYPEGNLIADNSENLYGMTLEGGNYNGSECETAGCGTVFEVKPNGDKKTLHAFQSGTDGSFPEGGVITDAAGNLYGTTFAGGGCSANSSGCGTVFKVTSTGESVLYAFQGNSDGMFPEGSLIADNAGNLYGTTSFGGTFGAGTVFELSPTGQETLLYSFKGGSDGENPEAGLVMDKKGNLYGTTFEAGADSCGKTGYVGCGTVFELSPKGKEKVLYAFKTRHGGNPTAGLLLGAHDDLYGTTTDGGEDNYGVVFSLKK